MTTDEFAHFVTAQEPVQAGVVQELERVRKTSHWMWFCSRNSPALAKA